MPDTLLSNQAAAIKTVILTVTNVGQAYDYQPVPANNDWATFIDTYSTMVNGARVIRYWAVSLVGETREPRAFGGFGGPRRIVRKTSWIVRGYMSWIDPTSEADFRGVLGDVANALDAAQSLNGNCDLHTPVSFRLPGNSGGVLFGNHLCHYVELTFTAETEMDQIVS